MKKILSLVLVSMMVLSLFACAADSGKQSDTTAPSADTTTAETTTVEETTKLTAKLPDKKMNGFEFRVFSGDTSGRKGNDPLEETGEEINDAMYQRNIKLEEKYDFVFTTTHEEKQHELAGTTMKNSSLAGDNAYQLYLCYTKTSINYAMYVLPINNLTYVDYTMPWWFPQASKYWNIDGVQLALSGCFDLSLPGQVQCLAFNKDMFAELNWHASLYDLAREGKWTLDEYAKIGTAAARDLNGDGKMDENDRFAMAGHWKGYYSPFIGGIGGRFAVTDEQGYPIFKGGTDTELISAIETVKNMIRNNPNLYYNPTTKNNYTYTGAPYKSGQTLFNSVTINSFTGSLRDYDFESGVLPFPKLNAEQANYLSQTAYGHTPLVGNSLPKEEWENVGILMEAFAFNTYDELLPVYKERALKTKAATDMESADMIDIVWDSANYDFGVFCWEGQLADKIINNLFKDGNDGIVSFLTSHEPTMLQHAQNVRDAVAVVKESLVK